MATIKTQIVGGQRRIITKLVGGQQRVSCSCCIAADCCMYPNINFLGLFDFEDLPLELVGAEGTFTKVTEPYIIENVGEIFTVYYEGPAIDDSGDPERIYFVAELNLKPNEWTGGSILDYESNPCLISDSGIKDDTFAETYTVTVAYDNTVISSVLNRVSRCLWLTQDPDVEFIFAGVEYNSTTCKWEHHDPDDIVGIRQGPHNGPAGVYLNNVFNTTITIF